MENLKGLRVLIVEDESLVSMLLQDDLADIGCEVVDIASRLNQAKEKASTLDFDVAIVDINLSGENTSPVADTLARRGILFLFATGYGKIGVPEAYRDAPVLHKPFQQSDLVRALQDLLATRQRQQ